MTFESINQAYNSTFKPNKLTLGLVAPIESYATSPTPTLHRHIERIQLAETLGFSALWLRDIPFNVPAFNDAGQLFDPFVYLGYLASSTHTIALGVASIILPLRHPAHVAKSATSIDVLSGGRLLLGIASGDRPWEYPAMGVPFESRGEAFKESFNYIEQVWQDFPSFENAFGTVRGDVDILPKPTAQKVPMLITGASQQSPQWLATHGNGWLTYPRDPILQAKYITQWRKEAQEHSGFDKPVVQSLYIDLVQNHSGKPEPIHLGYRLNATQLVEHLQALEKVGVNHVALNVRFNNADIEETMELLAKEVLPYFKG